MATGVVIPLTIRDLTTEDLPSCAWSGGALHLSSIAEALERVAEQRILARGLHQAELTVEESNLRARALYDRLGYIACGRAPESWDQQAPDDMIFRYETVCTLMRKELS